MILQELLINYPDEVKAAIEIKIDANRHDTLEKWTEAELTRYRKAMMVFIEELKQLIPEKSENPCIILGGKYRDSWYDGEVDEYIAVNIFRIDELQQYHVEEQFLDLDTDQMTDEEINSYAEQILRLPHIDSYGYEFSPWEEWLGLQVDLESMKYFGLAECIADILSEMTFNGMTRESQEERREELEESANELQRILDMPEEEQKNHLISWDEVRRELESEFDLQDNRTEEEKEQEKSEQNLRLHRDAVWNFKMKQTAIRIWKNSSAS